jgi:hypothetical protein
VEDVLQGVKRITNYAKLASNVENPSSEANIDSNNNNANNDDNNDDDDVVK